MLHFKQLSNSSAPPPCRKISLPQNIKPLKTVKYCAEGQTSIKSTGYLSHVFCIIPLPHNFQLYPIGRTPELPPTTHPAARACHLVRVLRPPPYLLSKGKATYTVEHFAGFGGLFTFSDFQSLHEDRPSGDTLTWAVLGRDGGGVTGMQEPAQTSGDTVLGNSQQPYSVTSVMFLQHHCLLLELS